MNQKTQEELDEELMLSLLPTIDDMFNKLFAPKPPKNIEDEDDDKE